MNKKENLQFSLKKMYKSPLQTQFHCPICDEDIILLGTDRKICPICRTSLEPTQIKGDVKKEKIDIPQSIGDKIVEFVKNRLGL